MKLRDYQQKAVDAIFEEFKENQSTLAVLPTGCHSPEQLILKADGDLIRADEVYEGLLLRGDKGGFRRVLKTVSGLSQMVRIIPTKGDPFVVTLDHKLTLVRTGEKAVPKYPCQKKEGETIDVKVCDWLLWPKWKKHIHKLYREPIDFIECNPVFFTQRHVHPYLLGVLLGDGSLCGGSFTITTEDQEIVDEANNFLREWNLHLKDSGSDTSGNARSYILKSNEKWKHSGLRKFLNTLNLVGTKSGTKHIPFEYSRATRQRRLELLAGIMDTDGSSTGGGFDYVTKSKRLAEDVAFVCRSVGFAAYIKPCKKKCQNGFIGNYFRVSISGDCSIVPCRIIRKKPSIRKQKKDVLRTGFTVERIGVGKYCGFEVGGNHRYLMGDFTVTHNCGKTQIFCEVVKRFLPSRSIVIAHREELINQAVDRLQSFGIAAEVEMADRRASVNLWNASPVVVSTIQTQISGNGGKGRMEIFDPHTFGLVVVDETHHITAASYKRMLAHYQKNPQIKILGVTATPDRTDEEALGQIFQTVAFDYEILDAIKDGWLVPITQQLVTIEGLDFTAVRTTAGDLNGADLARVMETEKTMQGVASASLEIIENKKTLAFCASVKQAETLADIFNRHRPGMATSINGKTPKDERRTILNDFEEGKFQVLCNCAVLTEGYDCCAIEVILMAKPTKSRALYSQMVGRSTRPLKGTVDGLDTPFERDMAISTSEKKECIIVDFVGNSGRHKLMTTADILGGNVSDEAIERAEAKAKKEGGRHNMAKLLEEEEEKLKQEAIERAKKLEEQRQHDAARRAHLVGKARFSVQTINPFDTFHLTPERSRGWDSGKSLSDKQRGVLLKAGINPDGLPYHQQKQLLNETFRRWGGKLCSLKQANLLNKHGYAGVQNMTMKEASDHIDALAKNNWKRPVEVAS